MTRNLSGSLKRWITLMMPLESVIDSFASIELEKHLPRDARVVPGSGVVHEGQLRMELESIEFLPVPHGNVIPEKTAAQVTRKSSER